ncbi:MAG: ATP-binding protein [Bryobacteraceae bacterium]
MALLSLGTRTRERIGEEARLMLETTANLVGEIIGRFQAEEAVRESERRHREIFDSAPTPLWEADFSGLVDYVKDLIDRGVSDPVAYFTEHQPEIWKLLSLIRVRNVNQAAAGFYRAKSRKEMVRRLIEIFTPQAFEAISRDVLRLIDGSTRHEIEIRTNTLDGEPRDVLVRLAAVPGCERTLSRVIISMLDLTARKRAERQLRESNRKLDALVLHLPGVLIRHRNRPGWPIEYIGGRVEEVCGYPAERFQGSGSLDYLSVLVEEDRKQLSEAVRQAMLNRRPYAAEYRIRTETGQLRWIGEEGIPIFQGDEVEALECFLVDITDRKEAEAERQLLQAQLAQAQKMESIGRLAGGVAHDFNNVLTVINGYSQLAAERAQHDPALHGLIEEIHKAGERAASLTRQLLAFSRKQVLKPEPVNLNGTIRDMQAMLRRLMGEDVELVTRLEENLDAAHADVGQMQQVLMNLVVNARDAMPNGGRLTIVTENADIGEPEKARCPAARAGKFVCLTVSDTGEGMSEEVRCHIFEPFFTTKSGSGTGLGLATVYGAVERCGGWISVDSAPGKGSTFRVFLPCANACAAAAEPAPAMAIRHGHETILVVEDQKEVRGLVTVALRVYGYHVLEAASGSEALEMFASRDGRVDLLLTDMVMPGMNGTDLARKLVERKPDLKVLYMSGYSEDLAERRCELSPVSSYLPKPFTPDGLAAKVREVLG